MNDRKLPAVAELFGVSMQSWMAAHAVPRGSVAVMCDNRLVFAAGYGGRGINERVPVWSLSKAITAICIAGLIGEGKLRLDDLIGPHLAPAFAKFGQPADERLKCVTVAQLVTHRSGMPRALDENLFAPGLVQLLREHPPREAKVEMLMPRILQARLLRDPGVLFEYTNMGYLLLGQIIEALTGQTYEVACTQRVFAVAGVRNPRLDGEWGSIMQAASGWALSGPEFLASIRLLHIRSRNLFTPEVAEFLCRPEGKWMNPERTVAYTLGVIIEPFADSEPTFLHSGGHNWNQHDAAGGPIDEARATSFALMGDGAAWFVSYDGLSAGTNPQATTALNRELGRACKQVLSCPETDYFPAMGIGPVLY
jgi:CubicO group peptidase (beta-lactamase class C family)